MPIVYPLAPSDSLKTPVIPSVFCSLWQGDVGVCKAEPEDASFEVEARPFKEKCEEGLQMLHCRSL